MKLNFISVGILFFLAACASHKDVRPGANGVNWVKITTDDPSEGSRNALKQANSYCKEFKQHPAIISEDKKYTGTMNEADYNTAKRVSKTAQSVGGAVWATGDSQGSEDAGQVLGMGGGAASQIMGDAYVVEMKFTCK